MSAHSRTSSERCGVPQVREADGAHPHGPAALWLCGGAGGAAQRGDAGEACSLSGVRVCARAHMCLCVFNGFTVQLIHFLLYSFYVLIIILLFSLYLVPFADDLTYHKLYVISVCNIMCNIVLCIWKSKEQLTDLIRCGQSNELAEDYSSFSPAVCSCRCGASCATGPAFVPVRPPSVPPEFPWCWMAAGAARCAPGSEVRPALPWFPVTSGEDCSVTTAPASRGGLGSVSVSAPSNKQTEIFTFCSAERLLALCHNVLTSISRAAVDTFAPATSHKAW